MQKAQNIDIWTIINILLLFDAINCYHFLNSSLWLNIVWLKSFSMWINELYDGNDDDDGIILIIFLIIEQFSIFLLHPILLSFFAYLLCFY